MTRAPDIDPSSSPDAPPSGEPPSRLAIWQARLERLLARLHPWRWLWPPMALAAGLASFFLVERQQWLGAMLALGMLMAWLLLLSEGLIGRLLVRRGYPALPRGVTAFIAQLIHQETLFFTLPFLLATTVWASGQALFTLLILAMALLSILDPLYYRLAERHRWLYFAFHAQCVFVVVLVTLPTLLQLTTGQSLVLAILAMLLFSLPSLVHLLRPLTRPRLLAMLALLPLLAGAAWTGRTWVPPASLWISGSALSPDFARQARHPQGSTPLTPAALTGQGLYAYTAIHAPRGLNEEVVHVWRQDGVEVDRIPLSIRGGRAAGYRAWSHKQNFPEDPRGAWRIDVMTDSGQRIGMLRFTVSEDKEAATLADGTIHAPSGIPGLDLRRLLPKPASPDDASPDDASRSAGQAGPGAVTPTDEEASDAQR
ncbi:hypothetical protein FIU83_12315 [Halomonas sp. THAF5a]|uniref:DUF5924 family protein n=1 Tax=Halomonas sp. THAF5a TaxID=2587844 RepID=UPI0012698224|nr:DUF5924 family protein [Halomonas sp. THAF5a]QFU02422.1 hypothetical protein FIU83_12315 [Halomonas sp. THAF5a]